MNDMHGHPTGARPDSTDALQRPGPGQPTGPQLVTDNQGLGVENIGKRFKKRPVVRGVSMTLQRGEVVGLLGPNGAGKTTCFYMITGLIPPDHGRILLDGHDITELPMYRRARLGIGYLPQEASIFRGLSVENNIRAVLEVVEKSRERREAILEALLAEFSITHLRRRRLSRFPAVKGAVSRSPVRSRPIRISCCWTNRLPASTRSPSAISATWSLT